MDRGAACGRVDALLDDDAADGAAIWHLLPLRDDGGAGACFYICGQAGFAHTVIERVLDAIARADLDFVAGVKAAVRDGLIAFEQHQDQLPARGRDQLVGALLRIPPLVERYHDQLLARE